MTVFDYVVLYVPDEDESDKSLVAKIVVEGRILAKDQSTAQFKVSRLIPEEYADKFDDIQIAVRPF